VAVVTARENFPALFLLCNLYLWEDMDTEYDNAYLAAAGMLKDNRLRDAIRVAGEIERLFETTSSEAQRWVVMDDLHIGWIHEKPGELDSFLRYVHSLYRAAGEARSQSDRPGV